MSRLSDLIRQVGLNNEALAKELQGEVAALADRRSFGLNFERHVPEAVELPGRPVRRRDKVRVLPPRGEIPKKADDKVWRVADLVCTDGGRVAELIALNDDTETTSAVVGDLVVVAEFRDPIYPGLVSTGKVVRGGPDKPFHTVINAENYHALQALQFTHRGKIDAIYIDPPYNTGAKDWKYNNDYVEGDDIYRHSKWLAFMERRLLLAKDLLKPDSSTLVISIDEKEYMRLGLLIEQVFPEANVQMVTSRINATGAIRYNEFTRVNEFIFFVKIGSATLAPESSGSAGGEVPWNLLQRREMPSRRGGPQPGPDQFYPIYIDDCSTQVRSIGEPIPLDVPRETAPEVEGCTTIFPMKPDGTEMNGGLTPPSLRRLLEKGYVRVVRNVRKGSQGYSIYYLTSGKVRAITEGKAEIKSHRAGGSVVANYVDGQTAMPSTMWDREAHNSQSHGTKLLARFLPGRKFPFPKSMYAIEDALRICVGLNPDAVVLDFFAGSGTTAHSVMRLNRQDGGRRRCILVTNNEVSSEEQKMLRDQQLRPGDPAWERLGICDYITRPRIEAAVTGKTSSGSPVSGDYKFIDEVPMKDGFEESVEFFNLTYEAPLRVTTHREFERIAPLLWFRAGSVGRRIEDVSRGWDVAEAYGVLADLDYVDDFLLAIRHQPTATVAFIVTDEDRLFESLARGLPEHVEPVRLYEAYLRNFEIQSGRGAR